MKFVLILEVETSFIATNLGAQAAEVRINNSTCGLLYFMGPTCLYTTMHSSVHRSISVYTLPSSYTQIIAEHVSSALTQKGIFWVNTSQPFDFKRSQSGRLILTRETLILVWI